MLRYGGLISHASKKHEVNPLEIIAIIMAKSNFKENSINKETGDYSWANQLGALGQRPGIDAPPTSGSVDQHLLNLPCL
jgi:hypothetical protein